MSVRIDGPTGTKECYALNFDGGYHTDYFSAYPPEAEIADARRAAPDAETYVQYIRAGWDSFTIHEWPPLNDGLL